MASETAELIALRKGMAELSRENKRLNDILQLKNAYIRDKVNQLLDVMGTNKLREDELDDNSIIEFDPLGIIFDSFRHILANQKLKNQQLQLLNDELVAIFSAAQVGIMVVDREFRILSFNKKMEEIFFSGIPKEAIAGATCKNLVCRGEIPDRICAVKLILGGAELASLKAWEVRGHTLDVEAAPIFNKDGEVTRVVLVYNDITDLQRTQKELGQLNADLEQRVAERTSLYQEINNELESFCYSISHDLRAPLRHISGFTGILQEEYGAFLNEAGRDILQRICTVSGKMGGMIDDLLRISRVSRASMDMAAVDISRLAEDTATMFHEAEPDRQVTFRIDKGLSTRGDAALLEIVMQNLIGNAWKYSADNPDAVIEVGSMAMDGNDVFFVRDNGVGFDMAYSDKLFRVFERLHGAEFEGSGIGLATVQRIISRHRGEVWAQGKVGEGATFYFTLPHADR